ncbi:hypothetical protein VPH35_089634 [Triticum aestivum]
MPPASNSTNQAEPLFSSCFPLYLFLTVAPSLSFAGTTGAPPRHGLAELCPRQRLKPPPFAPDPVPPSDPVVPVPFWPVPADAVLDPIPIASRRQVPLLPLFERRRLQSHSRIDRSSPSHLSRVASMDDRHVARERPPLPHLQQPQPSLHS